MKHLAHTLSLLALAAALASCSLPELLLDTGSSTAQTPAALFFGIADYPPLGTYDPENQNSNDLSRTVNDATAMYNHFINGGWDATLETNGACTLSAVASWASTTAAASQSGRRVLFYYSGHGSNSTDPAKDTASLCLVNAANIDYVYADELATALQPLFDKGCRVSLIFDSCYSGGFVFDSTSVDTIAADYTDGLNPAAPFYNAWRALAEWFGNSNAASSDSAASQTFDPSKVWAISAAGWAEESWEGSSYTLDDDDSSWTYAGHGVFTWAFLKGTEYTARGYMAADTNTDGYTSLRELYAHASAKVQSEWDAVYPSYYSADFLPHISSNYTDIMLFTR